MPQQNESHRHPSRRTPSRTSNTSQTPYVSPRANSSRVSASQRMSVPNARDELERERELYSAHDPNQNAPSPAQRYAQAQQNKTSDNGQNYWTHRSETSGRTNYTNDSQNVTYTKRPAYRPLGQPDVSPSRTSRTPHVGEATLSGQIPRQTAPAASGPLPQQGSLPQANTSSHQVAPSMSGSLPRQASPGTSGTMPRQGGAPGASGTMPRQASASASGTIPRQDEPSRSGTMPQQTTQRPNRRNTSPTRRSVSQKRGARAARTDTAKYPANAASRIPESSDFGAERYLSAQRTRRKPSGSLRNKLIAGAVAVAVVAIGIFAFTTWDANKAVSVTINGQQQTIEGQQRTIEGLLDTNTVSVTPGNYVAVDGSVMREGEGTRATATINGQGTEDFSTRLNEGDDISLTNGSDITEEYTEGEPQALQPTLEVQGTGAVHLYTQKGEPGEKVVRTGNESGKTAEVTTKEPVNGVVQYYNVNTNGDKVIALTFDDGPWDTSTAAILDTLKEYDAKATFFTVGQKISGHEDLLQRAANEGHEIGTHTWDHAEGSGQGVSLILMSSDERKQEVEKGLQAIKDATGQDASLMFRSPGGNFDASVASDLSDLIDAEIGWNIDTGDWQKPGVDTIAQRIESAGPGEIILMHDGGGDRSETVAALKQALPKLKEEGYRFVTVSELINSYPYQG